MKHLAYLISLCLAALALSACSDRDDIFAEGADPQELTDLDARMSRATTVAALREYVGRHQFADKDVAVFTTIKRAINPIGQYTYRNIEFNCAATTDSKGNTSIGWSRDKDKGKTDGGDRSPDRIYWTDATNPHTFIGYCVPQQGGVGTFDWEHTEDTRSQPAVYYGSIGDPTASGPIDFSTTGTAPDTISGNVELRKNDILLTYSNSIKADDAIAKLYFHHGLAQVRVMVSISDFAAGGGDDTKSRVSDMTLKNMLMLYKWQQSSSETQYLLPDDQTNLNTLYSSPAPQYDQRKDVKLWNPNADGIGEKSSRTFTYYGLAVPTEISAGAPLAFSFKVTYPNPMHPETMVTKDYSGSISGIRFDAGKCTTINIALNHRNEKMTVGAEYDEWDFVDTPDHGVLKKHSTFLDTADRDSVTIFGDTKATVDDATWLYVDATTKELRDVYGHRGTATDPFVISTARELLSFAYEVKGTRRPAVTYTNLGGSSVELAAGAPFDFTDYNVRLDADITMQPSSKVLHDGSGFYTLGDNDSHDSTNGVTWIGIGETGKAFNGYLMGGSRHINHLYGKALFAQIGPNGIVEHFNITNTLGITGRGSVAELNEGVICGFNIEGNIKVEDSSARYCGCIAGNNTGVLLACSVIGDIEGYGIVGALVGRNDGIVAASYCVGDAKTKSRDGHAYAGVGEFTERSIAYSCYFNSDKFMGTDYASLIEKGTIGHVAFPLTTAQMMTDKFVNLPCVIDPETQLPTSGQIIDDGTVHNDIFYSHFSLNTGLKRSIEYFFSVLGQTPHTQDDHIYLHAPGTSYTEDSEHQVTLPKTIAEWLIAHFGFDASHPTDWNIIYSFKYVPATYPKLQ